MEIHKVVLRREREKYKWESEALFVRKIIAAILNSAGKVSKKDVLETDIIKLSFDKKEVEVKEPLTEKGMKIKLGSKFKKDG